MSKLAYCKNCGEDIKAAEDFCSACGIDLSSSLGKGRRIKGIIKVILLIFTGLLLVLYYQHSVSDIKVPGKYATIQDAIDAAREGKTIVVEPGIYKENIDFKGKILTLKSTDPDNPEVVAATIIDGDGKGSVVVFTQGENNETVLSGFTITGGSGTWLALEYEEEGEQVKLEGFFGGGILVLDGSSPTITNNIIRGNECTGEGGGGGIAVWGASAAIAGNTISVNSAKSGGGIFVGGGSFAAIGNNTFNENDAVNGGGIYVGFNSSVIVEENTLSGNKAEQSEILF